MHTVTNNLYAFLYMYLIKPFGFCIPYHHVFLNSLSLILFYKACIYSVGCLWSLHLECFDFIQFLPFTLTLESTYKVALTLEHRNKGINTVVTAIVRKDVSWIWTCYSLKKIAVCLQMSKSRDVLIIGSWSWFFIQKHAEKRERYLILSNNSMRNIH